MSIVTTLLRKFSERTIDVVCAAVALAMLAGWMALMGLAWVWFIRLAAS